MNKTTPTLAEVQKAFEDAVFHSDDRVNQWINNDDRGDAAKRMNIYRYAYRARLYDVLYVDYPTIHAILGDDLFHDACEGYLDTHPSTSFSVRWFGKNFAEYLAETEPYASHSYLAEMATFEWYKGECFDGKDSAIVSLDALSTIPPDAFAELTFSFTPTLRQLTCQYDTPTLWQTLNQSEDDDDTAEVPTQLQSPISWVLWRRNLSPSWLSLDVDHAWAMQAAQEGACFLDICDGLREWIDDAHIPARAASFVHTWLSEEMVSALHYPRANGVGIPRKSLD